MKNWRLLLLLISLNLFTSPHLKANETSLVELREEIKRFKTDPYPRQKTILLELFAEVDKQKLLKLDWNKIKILEKNMTTTAELTELQNYLTELTKESPKSIVENRGEIGVAFLFLLGLTFISYFLKKKSHKSAMPTLVSTFKKSARLELKGLSFLLNHKGQLVEMSEDAKRYFTDIDRDDFSSFLKVYLLYVNIKSANNLVKIRNIKELEQKLYYYKSKNLLLAGKSFRLIKFVEVRDLGLGVGIPGASA